MALLVLHGAAILVKVVIYMVIKTTMENILWQDEIQMIIHPPITLWHFYQKLEPQKSVIMKDAENQHLEMASVSICRKDVQNQFFLAKLRKFLGSIRSV